MRILWVNPNFLHPTTKGGQIRTLETLRCLHRWHEIHYVAVANPAEPQGLARAGEYSFRAYPFLHKVPAKASPAFAFQLAAGLFSGLPVAVSRFRSPAMARFVADSLRSGDYDCAVCDFLAAAPNFPSLRGCVLFQHNVETIIWRRRVENARNRVERAYLALQARRMFDYEKRSAKEAAFTITVSKADTQTHGELFGVERAASVPTGVDVAYFTPDATDAPVTDLAFTGSMDWMPNADGMDWFLTEVLPRIHARRPGCTLSIIGRDPSPRLVALAASDRRIRVTGRVPDVRPHLWESAVSIVPLRIGGGTRLKIYESMAARVPVVSTTIGAEGLPLAPGRHLLVADTAEAFAEACLRLLGDQTLRRKMASEAAGYVAANFSWEAVARRFEALLEHGRRFAKT